LTERRDGADVIIFHNLHTMESGDSSGIAAADHSQAGVQDVAGYAQNTYPASQQATDGSTWAAYGYPSDYAQSYYTQNDPYAAQQYQNMYQNAMYQYPYYPSYDPSYAYVLAKASIK
jgi:hypothetical protein